MPALNVSRRDTIRQRLLPPRPGESSCRVTHCTLRTVNTPDGGDAVIERVDTANLQKRTFFESGKMCDQEGDNKEGAIMVNGARTSPSTDPTPSSINIHSISISSTELSPCETDTPTPPPVETSTPCETDSPTPPPASPTPCETDTPTPLPATSTPVSPTTPCETDTPTPPPASSTSSSPVSWIECVKEGTLNANSNILSNPSVEQINEAIQDIQDIQDHERVPTSTVNPDYIYILDLDPSIATKLKEDELSFAGVRMTLAYEARCMVLKVKPHIQHDQMIWLFGLHFTHELEAMGLFVQNGDWIVRGAGAVFGDGSVKEPDFSFYPHNILQADGGGMRHPTMTLEVGVSESYQQLQSDCQWWHANTSGRCAQIFLIKITRRPVWRVDFEVWRSVSEARPGRKTRSSSKSVFCKSQHAYCQYGAVYGSPLTLDFELLMGRPPVPPREHDIVFDSTQLALIAREVVV
ncbi:unnamed protein product [Penicillium bialowiezense]